MPSEQIEHEGCSAITRERARERESEPAMSVGLLTAFLAGLVSFLSPCVLPLVPGYVSYVTGQSIDGHRAHLRARLSSLVLGVYFVLGFSAVFVALGAAATAVSRLFLSYRYEANIVGRGWRPQACVSRHTRYSAKSRPSCLRSTSPPFMRGCWSGHESSIGHCSAMGILSSSFAMGSFLRCPVWIRALGTRQRRKVRRPMIPLRRTG